MIIDNEINGYQLNNQIIKRIMHKNKQSGSEIVALAASNSALSWRQG